MFSSLTLSADLENFVYPTLFFGMGWVGNRLSMGDDIKELKARAESTNTIVNTTITELMIAKNDIFGIKESLSELKESVRLLSLNMRTLIRRSGQDS